MNNVIDRRKNGIVTRNRPAAPGEPFQPTLEKSQPGGYAALDSMTALVPTAQLGTGIAAAGKALLGDQTWGDVATQVELDAEAATRLANDNAEAATRAAADTTLQTNINNEATTRASADTTEAAARVTHQNLTTTAHGGIVASTDTRLSDSRAPNGAAGGDLAGTYPSPTVAALAITDAKVAAANKDGAVGTPSMRTLGTGALQAAAGTAPVAATDSAGVTAFGDGGKGIQITVDGLLVASTGTLDLDTGFGGGQGFTGILIITNTSSTNAGDRTQSVYGVAGRGAAATYTALFNVVTGLGCSFTLTTPSNGKIRLTNTFAGSSTNARMSFLGHQGT